LETGGIDEEMNNVVRSNLDKFESSLTPHLANFGHFDVRVRFYLSAREAVHPCSSFEMAIV
jgi:hypothetical protein